MPSNDCRINATSTNDLVRSCSRFDLPTPIADKRGSSNKPSHKCDRYNHTNPPMRSGLIYPRPSQISGVHQTNRRMNATATFPSRKRRIIYVLG